MKVTYFVIFSLACLATIYALPAKSDEVEFVPLEEQGGARPVIITGAGGPWSSPFDGLFESFANIMTRMRQQMDYLLRRLPLGNSTSEIAPSFPGFPDIDLSKGNTTSVTKVIDGHKVVINETEYKHEGDLGGAFFKVRIIDVQPDSSELTTEKNAEEITPITKDTESVESSYENEIPKNREIEVSNSIETFDQTDSHPPSQKIRRANWENLETFSAEDNSVESFYPYRDLSRDTYVNDLLADAGAPINPDAEIFSDVRIENNNYPYYQPRRRQPYERIVYPR